MNGTTLTLGPGWVLTTVSDVTLASDWTSLITWPEYWPVIGWPSLMSGASLGPAWPLSSKVNDFNQFQITDHTLAQPPMGQSHGATHNTRAQHFCVWILDGCHFDRGGDQEKLVWPPMCCWLTGARADGDLAGGTGRDRASNTHWSDCFITWRGSYWNSGLCTTHDEMMRDPSGRRHQNSENLKGRVRRWMERQQQSFWIILTLVLT